MAAWAFWLEPASLVTREHSIHLEAWPEPCTGLRIAVLSDLHVGSPYHGLDKLDEIVAETQASSPDLVLLAGDYVIHGVIGGRFTTPEAMAERLAKLSAPLGIYATLGNHDWWFDAARVQRALESANIQVLEDASVEITQNACRFWLTGISDYVEGPHDVARALAEVPSTATILALTHNPDVFPEIPPRVQLTIAGHTHGGQVFLPLVGRPIVPSRFGQRYAIGHVVEDGRHLLVSSGLGTSILPVRFRVPPEITLVTIWRG
jgi:predicted MPP superfamily phosphohydrolase